MPRDGCGAQQTRKLERSQETGEGVRNPGVGTVVDPDGLPHTGPERGMSSKGQGTLGAGVDRQTVGQPEERERLWRGTPSGMS